MSKKNLKDGLESLFGGPAVAEPSLPENSPLLERTEADKKNTAKHKRDPQKKKKRARSSKDFTSDLDTLFEAVVSPEYALATEALEEEIKQPKRPRNRVAVVGLDALIQKTTDEGFDHTSTKKRVTFIFEKKKLDKLKRIAKAEKAFLKDIMGKIVDDYTSKYDDEGRPIS